MPKNDRGNDITFATEVINESKNWWDRSKIDSSQTYLQSSLTKGNEYDVPKYWLHYVVQQLNKRIFVHITSILMQKKRRKEIIIFFWIFVPFYSLFVHSKVLSSLQWWRWGILCMTQNVFEQRRELFSSLLVCRVKSSQYFFIQR